MRGAHRSGGRDAVTAGEVQVAQLWEALHGVQGEALAVPRLQPRQLRARKAHLHHNRQQL